MPDFAFSMMEIATAQVSGEMHQTALGKGVSILAGQMRKLLESHALRGQRQLDVLLISDTLYDRLGDIRERPGGIVLDSLIRGGHSELLDKIQKMAFAGRPGQEVAGTLLSAYSDPLGENADPFDLHKLYTLLSTAEVGEAGLQWNLQRTVFKENPAHMEAQTRFPDALLYEVEETLFGAQRRSVFWDSNNPLPGTFRNCFDLIAGRRCICYCGFNNRKGQEIACCGCARDDNSDVEFLVKVATALKNNDQSAAYLGGILQPGKALENWRQAVDAFDRIKAERGLAGSVAKLVPHFMGRQSGMYAEWKSGVYVSRGRPFSSDLLKVSVRKADPPARGWR
jgi:hypothetical protein